MYMHPLSLEWTALNASTTPLYTDVSLSEFPVGCLSVSFAGPNYMGGGGGAGNASGVNGTAGNGTAVNGTAGGATGFALAYRFGSDSTINSSNTTGGGTGGNFTNSTGTNSTGGGNHTNSTGSGGTNSTIDPSSQSGAWRCAVRCCALVCGGASGTHRVTPGMCVQASAAPTWCCQA
jgi:hypothetical protein